MSTFLVYANLVYCAVNLGIYAWSPSAENADLSIGIFCGIISLFLLIQENK